MHHNNFFPLFSFLAFFSWKKKKNFHWSLTVKWKNAWIISVLPSEMSQSKHICVTKYKLRAYQQIDLKSQHWAVILIVWIEESLGPQPWDNPHMQRSGRWISSEEPQLWGTRWDQCPGGQEAKGFWERTWESMSSVTRKEGMNSLMRWGMSDHWIWSWEEHIDLQ